MDNTQEKANELVEKFATNQVDDHYKYHYAIQCAIIAVDEILELDVTWVDKQVVDKYSKTYTQDQCKEYWQEVKQHLEEML